MKIETIKKLPNILSLARIFSVPVILALLLIPMAGNAKWWVCAVLFVVSSATDGLDGYIARKYDAVTNTGKFIDPIADKLLVVTVMIWAAFDCGLSWVLIVTLLNTARELIISAFRLVASTAGAKVIAAGWLGKIKTCTQYVAMTAYILHPCFDAAWWIFTIFMIVMAVFTVWSCADYIWQNREVLKESN